MSDPGPSAAWQRVYGVAIDGVALDSSWSSSTPALIAGDDGERLGAYTLTRFRQEPDALDRWYEACQRGDVRPRDVQVYALLRGPDIVFRRTILNEAWPLRRESPLASDPALESVLFRCSWITSEGC